MFLSKRCFTLLLATAGGLLAWPAGAQAAGPLADLTTPGGYVSYLRIAVILICMMPWLAFCQWVDKDTAFLRRVNREMWNSVVLGGGVVAFALWLLMPWKTPGLFAAGMGVWFLVAGGSGAIYVIYRNSLVDHTARVFTPRHIQASLGGFRKSKEDKMDSVERVRLVDSTKSKVTVPTDPTKTDEYDAAQTLLFDALWRRATEVQLVVGASATRCVYRVDGVPTPRHELLTPEQAGMALRFIKKIAGLVVDEHRKPQDGAITGNIAGQDGNRTEIEVRSSGTTQHEQLTLKIVAEQNRLRVADLGMDEKQQAKFEEICKQPSGLVIISGPRGSGVTTTLYAALRNHDSFMQNLLTLEYEPLMDLENITQHVFDAGKHDAGYARQLQSVLRREPDVVMVSDCPDRETAHLAAKAARDGKKIYLGIQARDSFEALKKLLSLAGDTDTVAGALQAVINERLVRKLCVACRQPYKPDAGLLRKANLPVDKIDHLYRPPPEGLVDQKGRPIICTNCQGSGYFGRTGVFEVLEVDNNVKELIRAGQPVNAIRAQARQNRMLYLQETGLQKVMAGVTSMNEVLRVMRDEEAGGAKAAAGGAAANQASPTAAKQ
jgi:type II secretory ATPase GspE/PulE/Tfp pilus assembly ATPase PilB-like protein